MKLKPLHKRIFSVMTAVVISLVLLFPETGWAEGTDSTPTLGFKNRKTTDFTVSKNIYNKETDTEPMRETWSSYYNKEKLSEDEFAVTLYGGKDAQNMNALADKTYIRRTDGGAEYLRYYDNKTGTPVEYVLRPSSDGYMLYDMSGNLQTYTDNGVTYALGSEYRLSKLTSSTNPTRNAYRAMTVEEKFANDIVAFKSSIEPSIELYKKFSDKVSLTNKFSTDDNGNLTLRDGETATFPGLPHDTIKLLRAVESKESLDALMAKRADSGNDYSGEYKYTADLTFGDIAFDDSKASELECRNRYDKAENVITVTKQVGNYFEGTGITDIYADRQFKFEIVTKDDENVYHAIDPDAHIEYELYNKDGTVAEAQQLFKGTDNDYRTFSLSSDQYIKFFYFTDDDDIYVREILEEGEYEDSKTALNPDFSAYGAASSCIRSNTAADGLTEADEAVYQTYVQKQLDITTRKAQTFKNVPNVFTFKKIVSGTDTGEEFKFRLFEVDENGELVPAVLKFFKRGADDEDFVWTPGISDATQTDPDGGFVLKGGESVIFTNPRPDATYVIRETVHGMNYLPDTEEVSYDTRAIVDPAGSTFSSDLKSITNTYRSLSGLLVTKKVENNGDNRIPADAKYTFKLQKYNTTGGIWEDLKEGQSYVNGETDCVTTDNDSGTADGIGYFTLKADETAYFRNLNGKYRAVELNPNVSGNTSGITDDSAHIFMTEAENGSETNTYYNEKKSYNVPYTAVTPAGTENPSASGWYEESGGVYSLSEDTTVDGDKTYYVSTDAVSPSVDLGLTGSPQITFTNTVWDKEYYFDIEKIAYLDKYIHGDEGDPAQKFVFKVERFAEGTEVTRDSIPEEVFYVDLTCDAQMTFESGSWQCGGEAYHYSMTPYHGTDPFNDSSVTYRSFEIKRYYTKDGEDRVYAYPCTIWNGRKTVIVKRTGIYRISEDDRWSNTNYDYCNLSSLYKGYGADPDGVTDANDGKNYVMFSVSEQGCDKFLTDTTEISGAYRPTASFSNAESEYRYFTSGAYIDNSIKR